MKKFKAGTFDEPQIKQLMKDAAFTRQINKKERNA